MHCIFFRKDPPVDENYEKALTYMLDILEKQKNTHNKFFSVSERL